METHKSIFSLMARNMQAYTISWVTTFISSIVNVVWSTQVFHYDFVSGIDGALASQIGVVLVNELFLLWSVWISRKYLFGFGAIINLLLIVLMAAFICLLIYAPMTAFKTYAMLIGAQISGNSPLFDQINTWSGKLMGFVGTLSQIAPSQFHAQYDRLLSHLAATISGIVALLFLLSFIHRKKA